MNTTLPPAVLEAADVSAITQLILTERESRDLGHWERMRACFQPDSLVRLSWFTGTGADFVEGSIDMARRGMCAKHRLGPVRVRIAGDRALASLGAIIDIAARLDNVEVQLSSHARFLYRVQRHGLHWLIAGFEAIYMRDELAPAIPGQAVPVSPKDVAAYRPAYRMLSLLLARAGYAANGDLPGEDRPQTAETLYRQMCEWARLAP